MMRRDRDQGAIAPEKFADLLLVRSDPSVSIGAVRDLDLIVKNGVLYDPAEFDRAVGMLPRSAK